MAALSHLEDCARCSAEVDELSPAADQLLHLAPSAEPPVGFEAGVFERLGLQDKSTAVAAIPFSWRALYLAAQGGRRHRGLRTGRWFSASGLLSAMSRAAGMTTGAAPQLAGPHSSMTEPPFFRVAARRPGDGLCR